MICRAAQLCTMLSSCRPPPRSTSCSISMMIRPRLFAWRSMNAGGVMGSRFRAPTVAHVQAMLAADPRDPDEVLPFFGHDKDWQHVGSLRSMPSWPDAKRVLPAVGAGCADACVAHDQSVRGECNETFRGAVGHRARRGILRLETHQTRILTR
jgi:hypothetical protein